MQYRSLIPPAAALLADLCISCTVHLPPMGAKPSLRAKRKLPSRSTHHPFSASLRSRHGVVSQHLEPKCIGETGNSLGPRRWSTQGFTAIHTMRSTSTPQGLLDVSHKRPRSRRYDGGQCLAWPWCTLHLHDLQRLHGLPLSTEGTTDSVTLH